MDHRDETRQRFREAISTAIEQCGSIGLSDNVMVDEFVTALTHSHRTLQQGFLGVVKLALLKYSSNNCDLRNQAAMEWAKQVASLENSDLRFPFI